MLLFDGIDINGSERISLHYSGFDKVNYFDVSPKILLAGEKTKVIIRSKNPSIKLSGTYLVMVVPYYEYPYVPFEEYKDVIFEVTTKDGCLSIDYTFDTEQMYRIIVAEETEKGLGVLIKTTVYALQEDLYNLMPLCGDFHSHTIHSDGFETPESLLNAAVHHGLDFVAITDHNNYNGSAEAAIVAESKKIPITVINGEEYSSSFTNMHIISLGADKPLGKWNYFPDITPENKNYTAVDFSKILCKRIKENGGVSVMCHPLWKPFHRDGTRLDVPMSIVKELMEAEVFDAIEIVGGSPIDDLTTSCKQHIWARSFGATPDKTAYLGSTDSHTYSVDPICGKHFTLVFAKDNTQKDIVEAVRQKLTVAIQVIDSDNVLCFGDVRLCMFADFYIKDKLKNVQKL